MELTEHSPPPPPASSSIARTSCHLHSKGIPRRSILAVLHYRLVSAGWPMFFALYAVIIAAIAVPMCIVLISVTRTGWGGDIPARWRVWLWVVLRLLLGNGDIVLSFAELREGVGHRIATAAWICTGLCAFVVQSVFAALIFTRIQKRRPLFEFSKWAVISDLGLSGRPCISVRFGFVSNAVDAACTDIQTDFSVDVYPGDQRGRRTLKLPHISSGEPFMTAPAVTAILHELQPLSPISDYFPVDATGGFTLAATPEWDRRQPCLRLVVSCFDCQSGARVVEHHTWHADRIVFGRWADVYKVQHSERPPSTVLEYDKLHHVRTFPPGVAPTVLLAPPGSGMDASWIHPPPSPGSAALRAVLANRSAPPIPPILAPMKERSVSPVRARTEGAGLIPVAPVSSPMAGRLPIVPPIGAEGPLSVTSKSGTVEQWKVRLQLQQMQNQMDEVRAVMRRQSPKRDTSPPAAAVAAAPGPDRIIGTSSPPPPETQPPRYSLQYYEQQLRLRQNAAARASDGQ